MSETDSSLRQDLSGENDAVHGWRERLLPFMVRFLVVFAAFFLLASLAQLLYLQSHIRSAPHNSFDDIYTLLTPTTEISGDERMALLGARVALELESHALARRYHQANAQLMARVWMRYLGFLTGMTLSLVGAAFILGQLQGPKSTLQGKTGLIEISVKSASPGILLATLGVILMVTTIVTRHLVDVKDAPVYIQRWGAQVKLLTQENQPTNKSNKQQEYQGPVLDPVSKTKEVENLE